MFKYLKKLTLPFIAIGMVVSAGQTAFAGIGDTKVLTDSFGRTWYNPFEGLSNDDLLGVGGNTYENQFNAITAAGPQFIHASIEDVAQMYCDQYENDQSGSCATTAAVFDLYTAAFDLQFVDGEIKRKTARTTTLSTTLNSARLGTGSESPGFRDLETTLVSGTFKISTPDANIDIDEVIDDQLLLTRFGFMYYTTVAEPAVIGVFGGCLMAMGFMAYRRKKA